MLEMSALDLSINTIMSHISHSHVLSRVTRLLTSLKNVAKLRDVQRCHVQSLPPCTVLSQVTLAVPGLSWNSLTSQHPGMPELYLSPRIILELPHLPAPLWQSIPVCRGYTSVPGLSWNSLTLQHPCFRLSLYTRVIPQPLDYPGTTSSEKSLCRVSQKLIMWFHGVTSTAVLF